MSDDDDFSFDDGDETNLEREPYTDKTTFGTSFDEQLALREANAREGPVAKADPSGTEETLPVQPAKPKHLAYAATAMGPSFDKRVSQVGEKIAAMPPSDTPIAGVARPHPPVGTTGAAGANPAPFPPAKPAAPKPALPPAPKRALPPPARPAPLPAAPPVATARPAVPVGAPPQPAARAQTPMAAVDPQPASPAQPAGFDSKPAAPAQPGGLGSQPDAPAQPGGLGSQPDAPAQPGGLGSQPSAPQPMAPGPGPMMQDKQPVRGGSKGGVLPKTVMLSPGDFGPLGPPGSGQQPLNPTPFGAQPMGTPQPTSQQATGQTQFPQQPAAQPYAPIQAVPQATRPKRRSNLVVFALSALAVFLISGICIGGVVLYLLFVR